MRELIDQLIADALGPFQERMAEAQSAADDAQRRLRNQGRIGVVSAVKAKPPRCKVQHGDNETPWIKWLSLRAGGAREWDPPTVGEQCALLNYGGGDDGAQVIALCGLFSAANPAPWECLSVHGREYPDGTKFSYDHAQHRMTWDIGGSSIVADRNQIQLSSNGSTFLMDAAGIYLNGQLIQQAAPAIELNGPVTNQGGISTLSGSGMMSTGSIETDQDVVASGKSLVKHTHKEQGDGTSTSPPE